jgi:hypothetical protein
MARDRPVIYRRCPAIGNIADFAHGYPEPT